ncbi:MAG: hypothetical protein PVH55_04115 [Desulfobacterales bacterium]|jgi:hypothetical protein
MRNSDKIYLSKLALDPDLEPFDFENEADSDFVYSNQIDQFMDENINDLEDLFWRR